MEHTKKERYVINVHKPVKKCAAHAILLMAATTVGSIFGTLVILAIMGG